jgi:hypothetical protein
MRSNPVLTLHETTAFCLAPASAPAVAIMVLGPSSPWLLVAVVAYVAAFVFGTPLFVYLRHRGWSLAARCLLSAAVAGVLAALLLITTLLLAFSLPRFLDNLDGDAVFLAVGAAWGLGLGLVAGIALFTLLRVDDVPQAAGGAA